MTQSARLENWIPDVVVNPYDCSIDTLASAPDSTQFISFIGTSISPSIESISNNVIHTNSVFFYTGILILLVISIFGKVLHLNFLNFLKIGFFEKSMQDHEKKQVSNNIPFNNILFFSSIFFISLIFYVYFANNFSINDKTFRFIYLFLVNILLILIKLFIFFLLGKIFNATDLFKDFHRSMRDMYSSNVFTLFIISFLILSANAKTDFWFLILTLVLFSMMYIIRDINFIRKQINKKQSNIFFFIYFCTLEVLSIPVLIKTFYIFGNHFFVESFNI